MATIGIESRVKIGAGKRYSEGILDLELVCEWNGRALVSRGHDECLSPKGVTLYSRMTLEVLEAGLFPRQKFSEVKGKKRKRRMNHGEAGHQRWVKTALPQRRKGEGRLEAVWQLLLSVMLRWFSAPSGGSFPAFVCEAQPGPFNRDLEEVPLNLRSSNWLWESILR